MYHSKELNWLRNQFGSSLKESDEVCVLLPHFKTRRVTTQGVIFKVLHINLDN